MSTPVWEILLGPLGALALSLTANVFLYRKTEQQDARIEELQEARLADSKDTEELAKAMVRLHEGRR